MRQRVLGLIVGSLGVAAIAMPAAAGAATTHHHRHATRSTASGAVASGETPLTGATLASASSAALAADPGTVSSATSETDGSGAYEVIVTKSDGTRLKVIEDSAFNVLNSSTTSCR